jgi:hypothetical protein
VNAPGVPGFWMHETSGVLRPVVEKFIHGGVLSLAEIVTMRAYLRQWMEGDFLGPEIEDLRAMVECIVDMPTLRRWINAAVIAGIDPL